MTRVSIRRGDTPRINQAFTIVREMRMLLDSYGERVLIGEIYLPIERLVQYYGVTLEFPLL